MKKLLVVLTVLLVCSMPLLSMEVVSPDKNIKLVVELKNDAGNDGLNSIFYKVSYRVDASQYIEVLPLSKLGISREDQHFVNNLEVVNQGKPRRVREKYTMTHGKRLQCENIGNERVIHLKNRNGSLMDITFRVYNDGVAFRYSFPEQSENMYKVIDESTTFVIPNGSKRWMQAYTHAYEDYYPLNTDGSSIKPSQEWGFPALLQVRGQDIYALITEANILRNNCGTRLTNKEDSEVYKVMMPNIHEKILLKELPEEYNMSGVYTSLPWHSQWRVVIVGTLSTLVESTLVNDLSDPRTFTDVSWIEPGVASWEWWYNNHTGPRDYKVILDYIDLAAEMDWPFMLVDTRWDVMENGGNIEDVLSYAKSKDVKILVWYNSSTNIRNTLTPYGRLNTAADREKEFAWLSSIGIAGIKVDFFVGDQQDMMNYYINLLEDAARHKLLVNFHGNTIPRGWERTYPNFMTSEAVKGAEMYAFRETMGTNAHFHNTILPFTRNVIGSMDYTPVTFTDARYPHPTTYAHELALSVVFESGIQHFADNTTTYRSLPDAPRNFLKGMPVAWDDTKLIDGTPGEKVIMARKKGNKWYVGGISGLDDNANLKLSFDFLGRGVYTLTLIQDGAHNKQFNTKTIQVRRGDTIEVPCLPGGGFAGLISN